MTDGSDVLVIGGGPIGASCARALAGHGANVTLVRQPTTPGEAWRASAGLLTAQIEAAPNEPLFNLGIAGRDFYRREAGALLEHTGVDISLNRRGVLHLAVRDSQLSEFKEMVDWQRDRGHSASWLEPEEVLDSWPWIRTDHGGLWAEDDGTVDPVKVVEAFLADAVRLGARVIDDSIHGLWWDGDRLRGAVGESGRYSADAVVVAAGAWSGQLVDLPRPLSVEPIRGQMTAFDWPEGADDLTLYIDSNYLLKRGDELWAGATMEHAGFEAKVDPSKADAYLAPLSAALPALAKSRKQRHWAGLRPCTPDGLPIIGPEPRTEGLWYATGHGRQGILLAGVTGEVISGWLTGEGPVGELGFLRPERF